jgi:hypothetical protein
MFFLDSLENSFFYQKDAVFAIFNVEHHLNSFK